MYTEHNTMCVCQRNLLGTFGPNYIKFLFTIAQEKNKIPWQELPFYSICDAIIRLLKFQKNDKDIKKITKSSEKMVLG